MQQNWYFEKINSIGKPLTKFIKKKGGDTHIKIRKEMGDITFPADIKRMIRKQQEQVCTHKFDKLYQMEQFLEKKSKLLEQERIEKQANIAQERKLQTNISHENRSKNSFKKISKQNSAICKKELYTMTK